MWEKTELSKKELQESLKYWNTDIKKKAKFLFDENIDPAIMEEIRSRL